MNTEKKDYQGPLYAPWWKVEAGRKSFQEWLKKQQEQQEQQEKK